MYFHILRRNNIYGIIWWYFNSYIVGLQVQRALRKTANGVSVASLQRRKQATFKACPKTVERAVNFVIISNNNRLQKKLHIYIRGAYDKFPDSFCMGI